MAGRSKLPTYVHLYTLTSIKHTVRLESAPTHFSSCTLYGSLHGIRIVWLDHVSVNSFGKTLRTSVADHDRCTLNYCLMYDIYSHTRIFVYEEVIPQHFEFGRNTADIAMWPFTAASIALRADWLNFPFPVVWFCNLLRWRHKVELVSDHRRMQHSCLRSDVCNDKCAPLTRRASSNINLRVTLDVFCHGSDDVLTLTCDPEAVYIRDCVQSGRQSRQFDERNAFVTVAKWVSWRQILIQRQGWHHSYGMYQCT